MVKEKFKLPRSSYDELCKIIKSYGSLTKPASLEEVSKISRIGKTTISDNNAFLMAVGIIEGGNKKTATEKGQKLASALMHDQLLEIANGWRTIIENNDFLNKMILAVRIRKVMETSNFEAHIAYSSGEAKSAKVMTGSRTVIDILRTSGLVKEDGDRVVPAEVDVTQKTSVTAELKSDALIAKAPPLQVATPTGVSLHIEVRIDAKPSELEGLGEKLKDLIKSLSKIDSEQKELVDNAEREA